MSIARVHPQSWSWPDLVRRYHSLATFIVVGLIAIGISGLVCDGLRRIYGDNIIAGDAQSAHLSAGRCADLLSWFPHAADCGHAELAHHADEVVTYREVMLPVGALLGIAYWLARRRWLADDGEDAGVRRLRLSLGGAAFGLAALALFGSALAEHSTAGLGRNLSDGVLAAIAAAGYSLPAWRRRATG